MDGGATTLDAYLSGEAANGESYFRSFLAREDIARVARLRAMAHDAKDREAFLRDGLFIGWTQGDMRTGELKPVLQPVLAAVWAIERDGADGAQGEAALWAAWQAFQAERLRVLIHCL